jgi:carbonic anhydrase
MNKIFATAINCMDGRVQKPVADYIQNTFSVDYVDMITEPGPNKILADNADNAIIQSIKKRVEISVLKHNSKIIAIVGHADCAGNPESEAIQKEHLHEAMQVVRSWGLPVSEIIGLWLDTDFMPKPCSPKA